MLEGHQLQGTECRGAPWGGGGAGRCVAPPTALGALRSALRQPAPWAACCGAPRCGRCCAGHAFSACWCAPVPVSPVPVGNWADGGCAAFVCARATAKGLVLPRGLCKSNPQQPGTGLLAEESQSLCGETSRRVAPKAMGPRSLYGTVVAKVLKPEPEQA